MYPVKMVIACLMGLIASVQGCSDFARDDGSTVRVLSPASTQAVGQIRDMSTIVASVTPPGSLLREVGTIISGLAAISLIFDANRKKGTAIVVADAVNSLNKTMVAAGMVPASTIATVSTENPLKDQNVRIS